MKRMIIIVAICALLPAGGCGSHGVPVARVVTSFPDDGTQSYETVYEDGKAKKTDKFTPEEQRSSGRQQKGVASADRQMIFDPSVCDQEDQAVLRKIFCVFQKINRRMYSGAAAADHLDTIDVSQ